MSDKTSPSPSRGLRPADVKRIEITYDEIGALPSAGMVEVAVREKGVLFEMLAIMRANSQALIVFGQSALSTRDIALPVYHRWTWANDYPFASCLFLNDPTLYLDNSILGGWFQGTANHFYMETAAKIVGRIAAASGFPPEKIVFYGSSAGGFSSFMMAADLPGAHVVAEIPQIDMRRYHVKSAVERLRVFSYGGMSLEDIDKQYADRWDVVSRLKLRGTMPNTLYLQNTADKLHITNHMMPYLSSVGDLLSSHAGGRTPRILFEYYHGLAPNGDGHVVAPRPTTSRAIRAAFEMFVSAALPAR